MNRGVRFHRARGLTLLEMLVAIAIFALIGVMAYGVLNQVLRIRDRVTTERRFWTGLAMCFAHLQDDLSQARPRTVIDDDGLALPAFIIRPPDMQMPDAPQLEFTRGGVLVFGNAAHSDLERVGYELENHVLWRLSWPVLDRAPNTVPLKSAILRKVTEFRVRAFTSDRLWSDLWPQLSAGLTGSPAATGQLNPLPGGVEIKLSIRGRGRFKWLFLVNE
ncbi:MAG: type II secretion system minor pseudopilin GspJ [Acidiferrobacterales bacterium]